MDSILSTFFAWAVPNLIGAMAAATIAWFLMGMGKARHIQHLIFVAGAAGIAVIAVSLVAAVLGLSPVAPGALGAIAGVVSGMLLRRRVQ